MYSSLKAKKHKGISEIKLEDLGHINVICGKNNSGKTSILEALSTPDKFAIGKRVGSKEWLEELFGSSLIYVGRLNLSFPSLK